MPEKHRRNIQKTGLIRQSQRLAGLLLSLVLSICAVAGDLESGHIALERGDYAAALSRFEHAAEAGDPDAQYSLAGMYHEGQGVPRDPARAAYWYTKAAERGNAPAQYWLCIMHREAIGVQRDYAEAFYWCRRAAEQGHAQALFAVGQYYFDGLGHGFHRDHLRAYIWFSRAHALGDTEAAQMLLQLEQEMTPLQLIEARRLAGEWRPATAASPDR